MVLGFGNCGQGGDGRDPRDNPEYRKQMDELVRREEQAKRREVRFYYF